MRSFYDKDCDASLGSVYLLISPEDKRVCRTLGKFLQSAPRSVKPEFKDLWKEHRRDVTLAQNEEQFCPELKSIGKCWVRLFRCLHTISKFLYPFNSNLQNDRRESCSLRHFFLPGESKMTKVQTNTIIQFKVTEVIDTVRVYGKIEKVGNKPFIEVSIGNCHVYWYK